MVECTNTRNSRGVFQRLEQTGTSDHYGPWHSHDSAPQMGLYIGLAEVQKKNPKTSGISKAKPVCFFAFPCFAGVQDDWAILTMLDHNWEDKTNVWEV